MPSVFRRGSLYYTKFRTPKRFASVENRVHVVIGLGTDSEVEARALAPVVRARQEAEWSDRLGEAPEGRAARVIDFAQRLGREYRSAQELARAPLLEIVERVEALPANAAPKATATAALLGGVPRERIRVSSLFSIYADIVEVDIRQKTSEQRRVWASARQRAVANFIAAVGDLPVGEITREHAQKWRGWHAQRVLAGKIKADSANKDFSNFGSMLNKVLDAKGLPNAYPMSRIAIKSGKASATKTRPPLPDALIRSIILDGAKLARLNAEARDVLLAMLNTGARPSELINLLPRHIHLDAPVPFVAIREEGREVKNKSSERDIPLVGISLEAMQRRPNGFPSYFGRVTSWGNLVNKSLRKAGLPAPLTSYGLRHAFSDRLLRAGYSERVIADAMGHEIDRMRYGEGLSLSERRDALVKIAY